MNIFKNLVIFLYLLIYLIVGGSLIAIALQVFPLGQITQAIDYLYSEQNLKMAMGIVGLMFVLIGIFSAQISFGKMQREKTIAFENPDGQVVISLGAIEDFIKRVVKEAHAVKELKSIITANKRGINILSRATLFSDSNIPETTSKIQAMIKVKMQEMLGIEEAINVKIHVAKLIPRNSKEEMAAPKEASRHMPFRGID